MPTITRIQLQGSGGEGRQLLGVVPLEDPGICEFKALSQGKSANRGTVGEA